MFTATLIEIIPILELLLVRRESSTKLLLVRHIHRRVHPEIVWLPLLVRHLIRLVLKILILITSKSKVRTVLQLVERVDLHTHLLLIHWHLSCHQRSFHRVPHCQTGSFEVWPTSFLDDIILNPFLIILGERLFAHRVALRVHAQFPHCLP